MTRHASYGKAHKKTTKRNVLKRFERIDFMKKVGKWDSEKQERVTGLPKTRTEV